MHVFGGETLSKARSELSMEIRDILSDTESSGDADPCEVERVIGHFATTFGLTKEFEATLKRKLADFSLRTD